MSIAGWAPRPVSASRKLLEMTIKMALCGDIVSVRATIRGVRLNAPYLQDSNEELTGVIVEIAKAWGLAVLFDGRRE